MSDAAIKFLRLTIISVLSLTVGVIALKSKDPLAVGLAGSIGLLIGYWYNRT
jgi:hypothetical protein